jgi:hypothetical protein
MNSISTRPYTDIHTTAQKTSSLLYGDISACAEDQTAGCDGPINRPAAAIRDESEGGIT